MAQRSLPGVGLTGFWDQGSNAWKAGMDENLLKLSVLTQLVVESRTAALPASPADGLIHIVPAADGANANKIAVRDNGAWFYIEPKVGWEGWVEDTSTKVRFLAGAWAAV